jgi:hypothetical protein
MTVRPELRALLEDQVREAEVAYERALRAYNDAQSALYAAFTDLNAYRKALQAATRDADEPYVPPALSYPLDGPVEKKEEAPKSQAPAPAPPRLTKTSLILKAMATANGKGMTVDEVLRAIPADAPIRISRGDLYRALPRLASDDRLWRDGRGRYHLGPKPAETEAAEGSLLN